MNQMDDWQLLRDYATRNSEEAFRALVDRYAGLVYHAALRQAGNPHTAEEVTQAVFIALAQKAGRIPRGAILSGWLFRATRFAFNNLAREQIRRQRREQEAVMMETILRPDDTASVWEQIVPHLNDALDRLPRKDREAVLVRFFQDKSHRELARTLGVSEDAAKVRVSRALEKLRLIFARQGFAMPSAVLLATISAHGAQAAPAGLTASVASVAVAKGTIGTTSTLTIAKGVLKIMAWTKAKTAIVVGTGMLLAAGTTTVTVNEIHVRQTEKLWRINKDLPSDQIDKLPPIVRVLPTKFKSVWVTWNSGANGDKFVGSNVRAGEIAAYAYGFPRGRVHFAEEEPTNRLDFVATLPRGSQGALQRMLKAKLGLVGRPETENRDVLLLQVNHANAPGLKPPILEKNDTYWSPGVFHSSDVVIDTGAPRFDGLAAFLERYFKMPVIDQTDVTQHFSTDLRWKETRGHPNHEGLEQVLLNQLGLELVPTNMPIEMLVVEKAK
jgi:uncharacterized protein (TIGR03435 family)